MCRTVWLFFLTVLGLKPKVSHRLGNALFAQPPREGSLSKEAYTSNRTASRLNQKSLFPLVSKTAGGLRTILEVCIKAQNPVQRVMRDSNHYTGLPSASESL